MAIWKISAAVILIWFWAFLSGGSDVAMLKTSALYDQYFKKLKIQFYSILFPSIGPQNKTVTLLCLHIYFMAYPLQIKNAPFTAMSFGATQADHKN